MLSRVADALYWMSRYVERAENVTRILTVNFHTLLDAGIEDNKAAWQPLVSLTGDDTLFRKYFDEYNARNVSEFLLWHPGNPNAVTHCLTRARENARSVREQISSEMWEHLNRLYLLVRDLDREITARGPYDFFDQIRHGSQSFQGITNETMNHSEAYEFIQIGKLLERADKAVRSIRLKYAMICGMEESREASLQMIAMLRLCSAFEAFHKAHSQMEIDRIVAFLLLDTEFPRAVRFCMQRVSRSVTQISRDTKRQTQTLNGPQRVIGRACAELEYLDIKEVLGERLDTYLDQLLLRINQVGDEITRTYFNTQVILPSKYAQSSQQQQQQQ